MGDAATLARREVPPILEREFVPLMGHDPKQLGPAFTVRMQEVTAYCTMVGDDNPAHIDSIDNPFGAPIVPAYLLAGLISKYCPKPIPYKVGSYVLVISNPNLVYRKPLFVDTEARMRCHISEPLKATVMGTTFTIDLGVVVDGKDIVRGQVKLMYALPGGGI